MRARPLAVAIAVLALALAGCGGGGSTGSHAASQHDPRTAATQGDGTVASPTAPGNAAAPTPTPSSGTTSAAPTLPDGTRKLFPGHRVVAYYGAAGGPALGVLGSASPNGIWPRLDRQAKAYDRKGTPVLPAYELITYVAAGSSGDGSYANRASNATIDRYAAAAHRHHALLILDIQPGRGDFLADAKTLTRWLKRPDVALALDPEWKLQGNEKPLQQIGHTDAATVNSVSSWLDGVTAAAHLPQKLLLIHQFTTDMVRDKAAVVTRPHLAVTFNMDGFGGRAAKLSKYRDLAKDKKFAIGMKLFYKHDVNIFSPRQTIALKPTPDVVDYE
jgi:hypothetical protein